MPRFAKLALVGDALLLLALWCPAFIPAHGQDVEISVLFLDGNTGHALKDTRVFVFDNSGNSDPAQPKSLLTDANGIVRIAVRRGSLMRAFVGRGYVRSCEDSSLAGQRDFNVDQVISGGIVEKSRCMAQGPPAEPGLLVRIVRKSTFLEALSEN